MGRVRERPRVLAAQALAIAAIAGAGLLIGIALGGDEDRSVPGTVQVRLPRAERSARISAKEAQALRAQATHERRAAVRAGRRNRRLRAELRRTRRALARARR